MILGLFSARTHPPCFTCIDIGELVLHCARSSEIHPSHKMPRTVVTRCYLQLWSNLAIGSPLNISLNKKENNIGKISKSRIN